MVTFTRSSLLQLVSRCALVLVGGALLSGCPSLPHKDPPRVYQNEKFQADETFSRLFDAPAASTCEAARRALLSQGYVLAMTKPDALQATKNFQPEGSMHVQISFNVMCLPEGRAGQISTAYVNAIQDRYTVKKSSNSASLGVSALGSVSIPLSSNEESLIKVGSETIPAGPFYDRFFVLMGRYLREQTQIE